MAFDVNFFRASLVNDGARQSLFEVRMALPPILGNGVLTYDVAFRIRASSLPADSMSQIEVPYFGRTIKIAGTRSFPDWSFTIINDEDFVARKNLEVWLNLINGHVTNLRAPQALSAYSYQADGVVTQFGKAGDVIKQYKMVGCFPTNVDEIPLDWASGDQIEEYGVTFAYQWWESILDGTTDISGA
jgi:hypothetical protein